MSETGKAIERANAYRDMMNMWAWKDLMVIFEGIKNQAFNVVDNTSIEELTVSKIAEAKGIRKGLDALISEINMILGTAGYKVE